MKRLENTVLKILNPFISISTFKQTLINDHSIIDYSNGPDLISAALSLFKNFLYHQRYDHFSKIEHYDISTSTLNAKIKFGKQFKY